MVFTTTNLFKGIECPVGSKCQLLNCIYSHSRPSPPKHSPEPYTTSGTPCTEPSYKRRKIADDQSDDDATKARQISRSRHIDPDSESLNETRGKVSPIQPPSNGEKTLQSPAKTKQSQLKVEKANSGKPGQPQKDEIDLTLNPRLLPHDPIGHSKRAVLLKLLHTEMERLNKSLLDKVGQQQVSGQVVEASHTLNSNELIKLALDEEEETARTQASVYPNVIKNRIGALKKMDMSTWLQHIKIKFARRFETSSPTQQQVDQIETGLTTSEEHLFLSRLVVPDQKTLLPFGYIPTPPTSEEADEAAAAVLASRNYEECDRCTARFQVFPNRNKEGELTSNGPCLYHPLRKVIPGKGKEDRYRSGLSGSGSSGAYYPCCDQSVGKEGCTECEHHVFKSSSPARLAAVFPFICTPENPKPSRMASGEPIEAITFDCEMSYTTLGLELVRLSAIAWPSARDIVDVLVKPLGLILDLNTRFSGVSREAMAQAKPWSGRKTMTKVDAQLKSSSTPLMFVNGPGQARALLCSFITPSTPLIGHAIENDLNAIRLCHPRIVDTVVLFPHHRGLPFRQGLRVLAFKHLQRKIQESSEKGHDSREDSVATGDLVRVRVREDWKSLRKLGWKIVQDKLVPPPPASPIPPPASV